MTGQNMAAITASLERSLQKFSINNQTSSTSQNDNSSKSTGGVGGGGGISRTSSSDLQENNYLKSNEQEATLELNSHLSLPYDWEQCLDLKTGEIYYINWRTGMRAKEDPRMRAQLSGELYSEDDTSYDSEGSSTEASPPSSGEKCRNSNDINQSNEMDHVLVVAGCKRCFMYFMVPKSVEDCPKCCGQLLHFDK